MLRCICGDIGLQWRGPRSRSKKSGKKFWKKLQNVVLQASTVFTKIHHNNLMLKK